MDRKIDQKKYLQKYLNPKKHKKKSQKKPQNSTKRVNIIDDDIDVSQMMPIGNSEIDIYTTGEDAPQIAGIIDERPIDVQLKERFKFNTQWKLINDDDGFNSQLIIKEQKSIIKDNIDEESKTSEGCSQDFSPNLKNIYSDDENRSTRKSRLNSTKVKYSDKNSDFSPPRNKEINSNTLKRDSSPFRKKNNDKESRYCSDSDASPPRKKYTNNLNSTKRRSSKQSDSDTSPPRRNFNKTIKSKQDSDTSPKRKSYFKSAKRVKRDSDLDTSPPRRKPSKQDSDTSPPRKKSLNSEKGKKQDSDSDSPTRKRNKNSSRWDQPDLDVNLPRKYNKNNKSDSDTSPPRKSNRQPVFNFETSKRNSDTSPPRNRKDKNRSRSGSPKNKNIVKFNIRNPDQAEKKLDAEKRKIQEEKYATWGKGLKQVEERREKIDNDSHEMSKPLARYANDEDLENFLKDQEREGDPMLEYIRKQNKTEKQDDKHSKPKYEGAFMPNRFGIPPGYRWDGVDRSNGYEANWFNVQNSKKILQEEAYKWSTDDM